VPGRHRSKHSHAQEVEDDSSDGEEDRLMLSRKSSISAFAQGTQAVAAAGSKAESITPPSADSLTPPSKAEGRPIASPSRTGAPGREGESAGGSGLASLLTAITGEPTIISNPNTPAGQSNARSLPASAAGGDESSDDEGMLLA